MVVALHPLLAGHERRYLVNAARPRDADRVRRLLEPIFGPDAFWAFDGPVSSDRWSRRAAELVREAAILAQAPDVLLFLPTDETQRDREVRSIGRLPAGPWTAAIVHDRPNAAADAANNSEQPSMVGPDLLLHAAQPPQLGFARRSDGREPTRCFEAGGLAQVARALEDLGARGARPVPLVCLDWSGSPHHETLRARARERPLTTLIAADDLATLAPRAAWALAARAGNGRGEVLHCVDPHHVPPATLPAMAAAPGLLALAGDQGADADGFARLATAVLPTAAVERLGLDAALAAVRTAPVQRRRLTLTLPRLPRSPGAAPLSHRLAALAGALAANEGSSGYRLLIDVSVIAANDHRTGIQRTTRALAREMLGWRGPALAVELVRLDADTGAIVCRTDRNYAAALLGEPAGPAKEEDVIDPGRGDIFLGLDLNTEAIPAAAAQGVLSRWRARGADLRFVIYDLLPLSLPHHFAAPLPERFGRWIEAVADAAHGLFCISHAIADELAVWLAARPMGAVPQLSWFHLGADLAASAPSLGITDAERSTLAAMAQGPAALMVGTVEPRKGHARIVDTFEVLWRRGEPTQLVIAGRPGWLSEPLLARLRGHAERGRRLHFLGGVSDECLDALYAAASGVIFASEGEGFGLPLIEAARQGTPVLASDLAVFREVAGDAATYLAPGDAGATADQVGRWLAACGRGEAPTSDGIARLTWRESAMQLKALLALTREDAR